MHHYSGTYIVLWNCLFHAFFAFFASTRASLYAYVSRYFAARYSPKVVARVGELGVMTISVIVSRRTPSSTAQITVHDDAVFRRLKRAVAPKLHQIAHVEHEHILARRTHGNPFIRLGVEHL